MCLSIGIRVPNDFVRLRLPLACGGGSSHLSELSQRIQKHRQIKNISEYCDNCEGQNINKGEKIVIKFHRNEDYFKFYESYEK